MPDTISGRMREEMWCDDEVNNKAATVVMGIVRAGPKNLVVLPGEVTHFYPASDWRHCMAVREKAVARYKAHLGKKISGREHPLESWSRRAFTSCLNAVLKSSTPYTPISPEDVVFATPRQITLAAIALVESTEQENGKNG